jgi:hypothetical protein
VKRTFYVALGAAVGVLAVRRVSRAVSALSPQSMAGSLVQSVQEFVADVREGMAEREEEIRRALGLDDVDPPPAEPAGGSAGGAAGGAGRAERPRVSGHRRP